MKTILAFDGWTAARGKFIQILPALEKLQYRMVLVHVGSWGHDKDRPVEEIDEGLIIRDIAYYRDEDLREIVRAEKPDGVLFLSTRAFPHKAVNLYARQLGIPTIHMYHGLVSVQDFGSKQAVYRSSWTTSARLALERAPKNLFKILPKYLNALRRVRAPLSFYRDVLSELTHKLRGVTTSIAPTASRTDAGIVYVRSDVAHMAYTYAMDRKDISVVGNPDLIKFGLHAGDLGAAFCESASTSSDVIYIETALIEQGLVFSSGAEYLEHVASVRDMLALSGKRMLFKAHPATRRSGLDQSIRAIGIEIVDDGDFVTTLRNSAGAIVEPSSAAMIPALLGVPLLLVGFGKFDAQPYGQPLMRYPRARYVNKITILGTMLDDLARPGDQSDFDDWAAEYAGPLPADEMPDRAAAVIDRLVRGAGGTLG